MNESKLAHEIKIRLGNSEKCFEVSRHIFETIYHGRYESRQASLIAGMLTGRMSKKDCDSCRLNQTTDDDVAEFCEKYGFTFSYCFHNDIYRIRLKDKEV